MLTTHAGEIQRHFTTPDVDPLEAVEWTKRPAWKEGDPHFRPEVEAPATWSQVAVDICAKLYLAKGEYREDSVRQMIERVSDKICEEGIKSGYFGEWPGEKSFTDDDEYPISALVFQDELHHILVNQLAAFNSPVWFNIGRPDRKQIVSACYILSPEDTTESIMGNADREAFIFKSGAGSGYNVSDLRSSHEPLSTGGVSSGPLSFMRIWDAVAGAIKSGGTTRRAARFVRMDCDHPDLIDFIEVKAREEERLRILAAAGVNISMDEEGERNVAESTSYQEANLSVGATDEFMRMATEGPGASWSLVARKSGEVADTVDPGEVLDKIAGAAWSCADPGLQFDTTINSWHTTPAQGSIRSGNACTEYVSNDDTACNLASINVLKFLDKDGSFDVEAFRHTVDVMVTAMDILVGFSEFPNDDEKLRDRVPKMRQLGLGYANMGAAVMAQGLPYDSDQARDFAASVTALMTGRAYRRSADLASQIGSFEYYKENRDSMLAVIDRHCQSLPTFDLMGVWGRAEEDWHDAKMLGESYGYRNAQATVLAPTGSISFLMDCDTTGIEPTFSLVTYKDLAGGGSIKLVNQGVDRALVSLGYDERHRDIILDQLKEEDVLPYQVLSAHGDVFAGANEILPEGHVKMVAAVQPFLSGAVSKTINMPESTSWQEIREMYVLAWRLGVKCMSVYRDGSKARQPLSTKSKEDFKPVVTVTATGEEVKVTGKPVFPMAETPHAEDAMEGPVGAERRRMPRDAQMLRHKFNIGGFEGYLMVGLYEDGTPGEFFLEDIGKEGSHVKGMTSAWAIQCSTALQYGQPLEVMVRKYIHMNFEPNGRTECSEIPTAQSLPDYVMRWMVLKFLPHMHAELGLLTDEEKRRRTAELDLREQITASLRNNGNGRAMIRPALQVEANSISGGGCPDCGGLLQRAGSCLQCRCGYTSGCS